MSKPPINIASLESERRAQLKALTSTPAISWPVIAIWVFATACYVAADVFAFMGILPLWIGMLINSVVGYYFFTVVHDSIHRVVSTNTRLNDFIGQTAVLMFAPYVDLKLFRWGHILHHRFTNGPKDPDQVLHGAAWTLPLRWMFIDVLYLIHTLKHGDRISRPYLRSSMRHAAVTAVIFGALVATGYGWHVLMLWFVPSRVIFIALGFSFFWLPHVPHDTTQEDNFTRATSVRIGFEWLMSPVLQCQNYHLIHHLYPMTPFYNNRKVWLLIEPELRKCDLAVQHGFDIQPTFYPAPAN